MVTKTVNKLSLWDHCVNQLKHCNKSNSTEKFELTSLIDMTSETAHYKSIIGNHISRISTVTEVTKRKEKKNVSVWPFLIYMYI